MAAPIFAGPVRRPSRTPLASAMSSSSTRATQAIKTPVRSSRANAFAERFVRTIRTECLDHLLVLFRGHLESVATEYLRHYTQVRPHRSLELAQPISRPATQSSSGTITRREVLGGIIHEYDVAA